MTNPTAIRGSIRQQRQQLQQQQQQVQAQQLAQQTQEELRKQTKLRGVRRRQKQRAFTGAKQEALTKVRERREKFEAGAKEVEQKLQAFESAQREASEWEQARKLVQKRGGWSVYIARGSPISSKVRQLVEEANLEGTTSTQVSVKEAQVRGALAKLDRGIKMEDIPQAELKAIKEAGIVKELNRGAVVSESIYRDIQRERPDLLRNISGFVPQEQITLAGEINKGRIGLDRPIMSGKDFEATGFRKGRQFGFSIVDKDTPINFTNALEFGQEISKQRTALNIVPRRRGIIELQDIEDQQKLQSIQKASYGQLFLSGDLPSLVRKPFLDTGEGAVGISYKKVFGRELSPVKKREWGALIGETLLLGFFSPAMDVGATRKGKQKVKAKLTEKQKKKALEKAIKFLQRDTGGTRNVKGVKQVRISNKPELFQQRLKDYDKLMRQIGRESNPAKKKQLFDQANELFKRSFGKEEGSRIAQEWASQQGYSMNLGRVKTPTGEFRLSIDMTTAPKIKEAVIPSGALTGFRIKEPKLSEMGLEVEKVGQISWLAPRTSLASLTKQKIKTDTLQKTQQKLRTDLLSASLQIPRTQQTTQQQTQQRTRQILRTAQIPRVRQTTQQQTRQRTISTNILMPRIPSSPRISLTFKPKPKIPTPLWFNFGGSPKIRKRRRPTRRRKPEDLFLVEVKRAGRFEPFTLARTKRRAFLKGRRRVKSTLEASFRVRSKRGIVPLAPTPEFRRSRSRKLTGTLVQRKTKDVFGFGSRLGTRAEVLAIKRAKKRKKKKPIKKRKSSKKKRK